MRDETNIDGVSNPTSPPACKALAPSSIATRSPVSQIARQRLAGSDRLEVCTATVCSAVQLPSRCRELTRDREPVDPDGAQETTRQHPAVLLGTKGST